VLAPMHATALHKNSKMMPANPMHAKVIERDLQTTLSSGSSSVCPHLTKLTLHHQHA
jgi:hypothetical protein